MNERIRKVDVEKMTPDQADALSKQIGEKVRGIADKACDEANKILNIYGMQAKMQFVFEKLEINQKTKG